MAKDPAFPWYASDFVTDTIQWTRAMQGLHCYLLSISWVNRGLTADSTGIPTGLQPSDVEIWDRIKHKWELSGGIFYSTKQESIREKRKNFISSQSDKGKASAAKRKISTGVQPIETEKEKENEDEILNEYQKWSAQILDGNDQYFEQAFMNEQIKLTPERFAEIIRDHLSLLNRYPKMRPDSQQRFRQSLLKHIRENKNKTNGNSTNKKDQQLTSLVTGHALRHGR